MPGDSRLRRLGRAFARLRVYCRARLHVLLQVAVFALSAGYFSLNLDTREVSLLEAQDLGIATELFKTYGLSADHSPLHFVFLNVWQRFNTNSVAFLRAPSALFCALSAVVVFCLVENIAGRVAGLLAAFFLATNPEVMDAARSLRLYSLVILGSACCSWFAYIYLTSRQRLRALAASVVVTVYTHLFAWLFAASLALLLGADFLRHRRDLRVRRRTLKYFCALTVILSPQLLHGIIASELVRGRHALYSGISAAPRAFLVAVARTLFMGEHEGEIAVSSYWLLAPLALTVLGVLAMKKPGAAVAGAIFVPALGGAWFLSRTSQVEARYLCFLAPPLAIFMAIGACRSPKPRYVAPVVLVVLWLFPLATRRAYGAAPTDWYEAAAHLERVRSRGDVVAVFPGYFVPTFRRYSSTQELVPITFPSDLQRLLARRKHVLLVVNGGRYFGNVQAELDERANWAPLFESQVRDTLRVLTVSAKRQETRPSVASDLNSILFLGVVGSGGYPWQADDNARPFSRLRSLFASSPFVVADYEAYHPPWLARVLLGPEQAGQLAPAPSNVGTLRSAGVSAVFMHCNSANCANDASVLSEGGVRVLASDSEGKVELFRLRRLAVGVFGVQLNAIDARADGMPPEVDAMLRRARTAVGEGGRLVAVFRASPDYSRLPSTLERRAAHRLIDAGVDVVVGEGGYAAKEIEAYSDGVIAYSLGTLLRPPTMSLAMRDSTGIALRLRFPVSGAARYTAFPLTFDDGIQAALVASSASSTTIAQQRTDHDAFSLVERLSTAQPTSISSEGQSHALGDFHAPLSCLRPWEQRFFERSAEVTRWFPDTPSSTPLRPFASGFCGVNAYAAERGVTSLGEYLRAIEMDGTRAAAVKLTFSHVTLSGALEFTYGIPDDRLLSKCLPLHGETLTFAVAGVAPVVANISYRAGWRTTSIDTSATRGTDSSVVITLQTNGTHFPVAIDARISGDTH